MLTLGVMGITPGKCLEIQLITSFPISQLPLCAVRTPPTITRGNALFPSEKNCTIFITEGEKINNPCK